MIELLYKSQETFFEAGGDQFDNCNAVCMHSGVMRQSLIDVTPFMPVSDFICEYCSQVRWLYLLPTCTRTAIPGPTHTLASSCARAPSCR